MRLKRLLPFWMMPGSWGLKGKIKQQAEVMYYWDGADMDRELALLEADSEIEREIINIGSKYKAGTIAKTQHDKLIADLKEEPWVDVPLLEVDENDPKQGAFDLDWNSHFILLLQEHGYTGKNDEEIINTWFNDVCRTVLVQENADQDFGLQQYTEERPDVIRTTAPKSRPKDKK